MNRSFDTLAIQDLCWWRQAGTKVLSVIRTVAEKSMEMFFKDMPFRPWYGTPYKMFHQAPDHERRGDVHDQFLYLLCFSA